MTTYNAHFEGQSAGTSVTPANSGTYGDSPTLNVYAINSVVAYSSGTSAHGTGAVGLTVNSGAATANPSLLYGSVSTGTFGTRCYFNFGSLPSVDTRIIAIKNATQITNGSGDMGGVNLKTNGTIEVTDTTGASLNKSSSATQFITTGAWYRFENLWNISTTAGWYKAAVYTGDSTTPWYSYTSAVNLNSGSTNIAGVAVGKSSLSGTFSGTWYVDDVTAFDNNTAFSGPYVPGGPSISTSVTGAYTKLDATGSSPVNGGALSYSISPSTGSYQVSPGIFMVPQTTSPGSVTLTVTEAGGNSSSTAVAIPALTTAASSQTTVMVQRYVGGSWQ